MLHKTQESAVDISSDSSDDAGSKDSSEDADSKDSVMSEHESDTSPTCSGCDISTQPQEIGLPALDMTATTAADPEPDLNAETDPEPGEPPEELPRDGQSNGCDNVSLESVEPDFKNLLKNPASADDDGMKPFEVIASRGHQL